MIRLLLLPLFGIALACSITNVTNECPPQTRIVDGGEAGATP